MGAGWVVVCVVSEVLKAAREVASSPSPDEAHRENSSPMQTPLRLFLCAIALLQASALVMQPRLASPTRSVAGTPIAVRMQMFGGSEKPEGLTRDNEPEEFFKTNMDDMTDAEKIKSPVVIGGLALLIAPFIVGAIALAFYR